MVLRLVTSFLVWAACALLAGSSLIAQSPDLILLSWKGRYCRREVLHCRGGRDS